MHELAIAMSILDVAAEQAERHGGRRVAAIHVRLGALAGVVQDALRSAFAMAREESPLDQAELVIEEMPIVVYCASCDAEHALTHVGEFRCPVCQALTAEVRGGRELEIIALEIES
jgi:hydrogenase nickel incorporation protein HypA/HybF